MAELFRDKLLLPVCAEPCSGSFYVMPVFLWYSFISTLVVAVKNEFFLRIVAAVEVKKRSISGRSRTWRWRIRWLVNAELLIGSPISDDNDDWTAISLYLVVSIGGDFDDCTEFSLEMTHRSLVTLMVCLVPPFD